MNEDLITELRQRASEAGVALVDVKDGIEARLRASGIEVVITVPRNVLEWWVEAMEGECRVQDWCDYEGYDSTPRDQLEKDMRADVLSFFTATTTRPLRFSNSKQSLEWEAQGRWQQAVPITEPNNGVQATCEDARG